MHALPPPRNSMASTPADFQFTPPLPPPQSRASFVLTPLIAALFVLILFVVSLAMLHYAVFYLCADRRERESGQPRPPTPSRPPPTVENLHLQVGQPPDGGDTAGVDWKTIAALPTYAYARRGRTTTAECAVCLGELEDRDLVRALPLCLHVFHVGCVDRWLAFRPDCPLCRAPVTAGEDSGSVVVKVEGQDEGSSYDVQHMANRLI